MTAQTLTPDSATRESKEFVAYLLNLRDSARARAALRDGDQQALAPRALPDLLLSRHLHELDLDAALLFASAIAGNSTIRHMPGVPFGRSLARAVDARDLSDKAASRLVTVQRQPLPLAHRSLKSLLTSLDRTRSASLDWDSLWHMYRLWDCTDLDVQQRTRRRLLLDYYGSATPID